MMASRRLNLFFIFAGMLLGTISGADEPKYSLEEARKVFGLIDRIQLEQLMKPASEVRQVVVTESEFNSYLAYRIEAENEEVMKELRFKFLADNRVEGKVFIDFKGQKLPAFLRPEMNLYFGGKIEVKDGMVRILIKEMFLEDQPIQPRLLDLVIYIASKIQDTEPTSINDWYELPYGIKDIKTKSRIAMFYY